MPDAARTRRIWLLAWFGGPLIGIANGAARDLLYLRRVGPLPAHQISTATGLGLFAAYFAALERRWPLPDSRTAGEVGAVWMLLTLAFEFGFGRWAGHKTWRELTEQYDMRRGYVWPLLVAWLAIGPCVARAVHHRRECR